MKNCTNLKCFLTFLTFLLSFVNLGYNEPMLNLYEGEICRKGDGKSDDSICRNIQRCPVAMEGIKKRIFYRICSFDISTPIVCCPPDPASYSATEMCEEYSSLTYLNKTDGSAFKINAQLGEFPHMALLGYSEKPDINSWACGGSLISKTFVLTAAHCEKLENKDGPRYAKWARLGELDYLSETDDARPKDYKIVERIIHPKYKSTSYYHDIALFRLEVDVEFSPFVRPICLNTDNTFRPSTLTAMGWGRTSAVSFPSSHLKKVQVKTISAVKCGPKFLNTPMEKKKLANGIVDNLMLCATVFLSKDGICDGDSGGPIQMRHENFTHMYSVLGITSFGTSFCGEDDTVTVYTRVSKYIPWIERIVWPKM